MQDGAKKSGKVLLVGRPNVGKSTFLNTLIGQKVAITSPKPQTTRFAIRALYEDERGSLLFIDTPGIFGKAEDKLSKSINKSTLQTVHEDVDIVVYMVDHTRRRDFEEGKVLGLVRKMDKPKILVINKIDKQEKSYLAQYAFLKSEFSDVFEISALHHLHYPKLIDRIFELVPFESEKTQIENRNPYPIVNLDSTIFIAELIREKVFLMMGEEIPYTTTAVVDSIKNRSDDLIYIKARILTTQVRYKRMLIGAAGRKIKEIGAYARKEIELAINKKIYLDLTVEVDPHWQELYT